ncbi:MAG: histidine kinase [Armatimonadota bacterium]|nr:histidine kinase [Armatimonadota bacterium]
MRLHLKISLWTIGILLVVGGVAIYALNAFQRRAAHGQIQHMAQLLTSTILNSLEITMIHNNQEEMREIIRLVKREETLRDVTIYSRNGSVWVTAGPDRIVRSCEAEALHQAIATRRSVTVEDACAEEIVVVTPVLNKSPCQQCHAADPQVLGAIGVSLWTAHVTPELQRSVRWLAVLVGFSILLALGTLNLLLGRAVLDPLSALVTTVRRVAGGEYQARAEVRGGDELAVLARSVNEMAERIEHYTAGLTTQIGDLTGRLASLGIFGRALTEASDLSAAMEEMTHGLRDVLRADLAAIYLTDGGMLCLAHRSGSGELPPRVAVGAGVIGRAAARRQPVGEPEFEPAPGSAGPTLAVPLVFKDRVMGALVVARHAWWPFSDADTSLLVTLSNQLSIAMENVRLFQEVREKEAHRGELLSKLITAHEDERRRIARELHDEVSQSLTGLMMTITAAEGVHDEQVLRQRLTAIYAAAEATLEEVRKIIHDLRPTALDDLGLVSAVRVHARNMLEAAGVRLTFEASGFGQRRLPAAVETTVFRVAQEAITNVARHARATAATVALRLENGTLHVLVEDNGRGFDPHQVLGRREDRPVGILGMQERAALIGGSLEIDAQPGRGARVRLVVPLKEMG